MMITVIAGSLSVLYNCLAFGAHRHCDKIKYSTLRKRTHESLVIDHAQYKMSNRSGIIWHGPDDFLGSTP